MKPGDEYWENALCLFSQVRSCLDCPRSIGGCWCGDPGWHPGLETKPCGSDKCPNNHNGQCAHPLHPLNISLEQLVAEDL